MRRAGCLIVVLALLAGCGRDDGGSRTLTTPKQAPPSSGTTPAAVHPDALKVAALGDSISAGSPLWDPDQAVRDKLGDSQTPASQYEYWAEKALGGSAKVQFQNCGVFGERTDQIAKRLDACADGAKVIVIQGGINDLAQGETPESAAAGLLSMVKRAKAMGLRAFLAEVLPWNGGYPAVTPKIKRLNVMIGRIGRGQRVPVLGFYKALEDPQRPGRMPSSLTLDETHPNPLGYRVMGKLVAKALKAAQEPSP